MLFYKYHAVYCNVNTKYLVCKNIYSHLLRSFAILPTMDGGNENRQGKYIKVSIF